MTSGSHRSDPRGVWSLLPLGVLVFLLGTTPLGGPLARFHGPASALATIDTLRGTPQDDVLQGSEGPDLLDGLAGDDRLAGHGGPDVLLGGDDRDVLDGGAGDDIQEGGAGDDWLLGGPDRDALFGEAGNDRLEGGDGPDLQDGGPGNDELHGGEGNDRLDGGEGDDVLFGDAGDDVLDGGDGIDILDGGEGADDLDGGDENDILRGGAGADTLRGADGHDELDGGAGDDYLAGDDGDDTLRGGPGNDGLAGRDGSDYLDGGAGDDFLNGGEGDDILAGRAGADTLLGWQGDDRLAGHAGADVLQGGEGDDLLEGAGDDDRLTGGLGTDIIRGGDGNDLIFLRVGDVDSGRTEVIEAGTNADTARAEADTLMLSGFTAGNIVRVASDTRQPLEIVDPATGGRYLVSDVEEIVFLQVVPAVAAGSARLYLINTSDQDLAGRLEFLGQGGTPQPTAIEGDSARAVHDLRLPPHGSAEFTFSLGGAAAIRAITSQPAVVAIHAALPDGQPGILAGSGLVDGFAIPVSLDRARGMSSGLAVASGAVAGPVRVWLYTERGQEVADADIPLTGRASTAVLLHELFPRVDRFQGQAVLRGGGLIAGAGTQVRDGRAAAVPVVPLSPAPGRGPVHLPSLGSGDATTTTLVLSALPPDTAKGRITFFDAGGRPLAVPVAGRGSTTEVPFVVRGGGTLRVIVDGDGQPARGSAIVSTEQGQVAASALVQRSGRAPEAVTGTTPVDGFVVEARRGDGGLTIVALSAGAMETTVELMLRDPGGADVSGGRTRVRLPAHGTAVRSLAELFPNVRAPFYGSLWGQASGAPIGVAVQEQGAERTARVPWLPLP